MNAFQFNGGVYIESPGAGSCKGCALDSINCLAPKKANQIPHCTPGMRTDHKDVVFKKIGTIPELGQEILTVRDELRKLNPAKDDLHMRFAADPAAKGDLYLHLSAEASASTAAVREREAARKLLDQLKQGPGAIGHRHVHPDTPQPGTSDGSSADYYVLPEGAAQLQDLISYRNMNGQDAEMFRAIYRKGRCSHSSKLREAKKVLFYAQAEVDRLEKYDA